MENPVVLMTGKTEPDLNFIPDNYAKEFEEHVIEKYKHFGDSFDFPDVADLFLTSSGFYLVGATYMDSGNPDEYSKLISSVEKPLDKDIFWESLYEKYNEPYYGDYKEMLVEDIQSVLFFHNMSYIYTWSAPISGELYEERFNIPIIEVW